MNDFLGVKINKFLPTDFSIEKYLKKNESVFIVTLNPEIILLASSDKSNNYRKILNLADYQIIDGIGIKIIGWLKGFHLPKRLTGVDLAIKLVREAIQKNIRITLIAKQMGLSSKEEIDFGFRKLFGNYQKLKILMTTENNFVPENFFEKNKKELILIGLGAPEQEKLGWKIKKIFSQQKILIGIGGTLDFWSGKQKRAPWWMQKIGVEWLWRLLTVKGRIARIFRATIIFPFKVIFN